MPDRAVELGGARGGDVSAAWPVIYLEKTFCPQQLADWWVVWFKVLHEMKQEISPDCVVQGLGWSGGRHIHSLQWRIDDPPAMSHFPSLHLSTRPHPRFPWPSPVVPGLRPP